MLKIRIAGLTAELDNRYAYVADQCRGYTVSEEERSDLTARATEEQIDALLVEMYEKQARPDCNPDDIIAIKAKINKIAGMKLY